MDEETIRLLKAERGNLPYITSVAGLPRKLRGYICGYCGDAEAFARVLRERGWRFFLDTAPGLGAAHARNLHDALAAAGHNLPKRP